MSSTLDDFLLTLGNPGRYQLFVFFVLCTTFFSASFHINSMIFLGVTPHHHCKFPQGWTWTLNESIPQVTVTGGLSKSDNCHRYFDPANESAGIIPCPDGWTYETEEWSIVRDWNLVCDDQYKVSLATTMFFAGMTVGSIFVGPLCDRLGRKIVILSSLYAQLLVAVAIAFAPNYTWFIPESFRWLISQHDTEEACLLAKKYIRFNGVPSRPYLRQEMEILAQNVGGNYEKTKRHCHTLGLFRTRRLALISSVNMMLWFCTYLSYYHSTYFMVSLNLNLYLNFLVSAITEFLFILILILTMNKIGRKIVLFTTLTVTAFLCLAVAILASVVGDTTDIRMFLALISKALSISACNCLSVYTSEQYPTIMRGLGIGSCAFWSRVSGIVGPQIVLWGSQSQEALPFFTLTLLNFVCAFLTLLLPETINKSMPETFEDVDELWNENKDVKDVKTEMGNENNAVSNELRAAKDKMGLSMENSTAVDLYMRFEYSSSSSEDSDEAEYNYILQKCYLSSQLTDLNTFNTSIYNNNNGTRETPQSCSTYVDPYNHSMGTIPCPNGWDYDPKTSGRSIVPEWNLVCDNKWQLSAGISIYFIGVMLGGLVGGYLADRFGRQPVILICIYCQTILGISVVFITNYIAFIVVRFFHAILMQALQACSFTLIMEMFQPTIRARASAFYSLGWTLGLMFLALISWALDNWRHVQLVLAVPSVVSFLYFWFIPESMRWLITHKKTDRAEALALKVAKFNNINFITDVRKQIDQLSVNCVTRVQKGSKHNSYGLIDLVRTPQIRKYTLIIAFVWFTASIVTYGIAYGLSSIASNIYISIAISGCVEIPLRGLSFLILNRFGRRRPIVLTLALSGISCIIVPIILHFGKTTSIGKTASTVAAIIGKAFMGLTYAIIPIYTVELYPTVIRTFGQGSAVFCSRIGGIVAPQLVLLGNIYWKPVPFLICGIFGIIAALLTLILPDTHLKSMPDMIEDVEIEAIRKSLQLNEDKSLVKGSAKPRTDDDDAIVMATLTNGLMKAVEMQVSSQDEQKQTKTSAAVNKGFVQDDTPISSKLEETVIPINQTLNDTIPMVGKNGKIQMEQCLMYANPINRSEGLMPCTDGWTYLYEKDEWTIVGEWDLVCDRKWLVGLVTTIYFGGTLLGSPILGTLADKCGRKPVFLGALYCGVIIGVIQFFSNSYVMFTILKFLHGTMIQGMINASTSHNMELFRKQHRTESAFAANFIWTLAQFVLVFFAFITSHWRYFYLLISLPSLFAISYIWLVPESLRWLLVNNRVEEAKKVAQKYARINKINLESNIDKQITNLGLTLANSEGGNNKYDFRDLFRTKYIRRTTILAIYLWFAASIVYYGINFSLPALGGNKYINFLISAGVELGSRLFLYPALKLGGRRLPNAIAFLLSGTLCIAVAMLDNFVAGDVGNMKWISIGCAFVGKAACSIAFACIVLLTSELLPTVIRGIALGVCGLANRIGAMSAPQILLLGELYSSEVLPFVCFGTAALLAAVVTWSVPETRHLSLPDTIEDAENLYSKQLRKQEKKNVHVNGHVNGVATVANTLEAMSTNGKGISNPSFETNEKL
uniref:Major facilitator superfamily (MFS) profile domain-containing protein n=1 Tax=Strigamia maritima TaxID=126957 RepID=T1IXG2_STRMM